MESTWSSLEVHWEFSGSPVGVHWESGGSLVGVHWEFSGSPVGVQWEFSGSLDLIHFAQVHWMGSCDQNLNIYISRLICYSNFIIY